MQSHTSSYDTIHKQNLFQSLVQREVYKVDAFNHKKICSNECFVRRFQVEHQLNHHNGCVNTVNWNSTGNILISGSDDCKVNLWDPFQSELLESIDTGHTGNIFSAQFVPFTNDTEIISCAADGNIKHIKIDHGRNKHTVMNTFDSHESMVHRLAVDPFDPHVILSAGHDGTVRQFDLRQPQNSHDNVVISLRKGTHSEESSYTKKRTKTVDINSLSINSRTGVHVAVGGGDPFVRIFDRRTEKCCKIMAPESVIAKNTNRASLPIHITGVRYNSLGTELVASYSGDYIYLFDTSASMANSFSSQSMSNSNEDLMNSEILDVDHSFLREFKGHRNIRTVKEVGFYGANDDYIVSGSDCGNVFMWNKNSSDIVQILPKADKYIVNCVSPHPCGVPVIATSGIEHDIKMWMPTSDRPADLENLQAIIQRNEKKIEEEQRMLVVPASMILGLLNMIRTNHEENDQAGNIGDENESEDSDQDVNLEYDAEFGESDNEEDPTGPAQCRVN